MQKDLIIEIGTEELPPMSLNKISLAFMEKIRAQLEVKNLSFGDIRPFATPRRIAVLVEKLIIDPNLIPEILRKAVSDLPGKKMRWGNGEHIFARPVHWLVVLFGSTVIPVTLFDVNSGNITYGHRFLAPDAIFLNNPLEYEHKLEAIGKVIVDFNKRKQLIIFEINAKEQELKAKCILDPNLLEEVTGMVEYPFALFAEFSKEFLIIFKLCLSNKRVTSFVHPLTYLKSNLQHILLLYNCIFRNSVKVLKLEISLGFSLLCVKVIFTVIG